MSKITDGINFLHFFANLKETLFELTKSLDGHSKELERLEKQNLMLLTTIQNLKENHDRLEERIGRLEANAMSLAPPRRQVQHQPLSDKPKLPADGGS